MIAHAIKYAEKIRQPSSLNYKTNFSGQGPTWEALISTARDAAKKKTPTVIVGPSGCGKSTLAWEIATWSRCEPLEYMAGLRQDNMVLSTLFTGLKANEAPSTNRVFLVDGADLTTLQMLVDATSAAEKAQSFTILMPNGDRDDIRAIYRSFCKDAGFAFLDIPGISARRDEIPYLVNEVADRVGKSLAVEIEISDEIIDFCQRANWPRNFNDLEEVMRRSYLSSCDSRISEVTFATEWDLLVRGESDIIDSGLEGMLSSLRTQLIFRALERSGGSQSGAARMLKVTPQAVHQFLKQRRLMGRRDMETAERAS